MTSKTSTPAQLDAMMERINRENAPAWLPAPNQVLRGRPVAVAMRNHEEYGDHPVITFATEDGGYIAYHAFHTMAREQVRERAAQLQEAVENDGGKKVWSVVYLGERVSRSRTDSKGEAQSYHLYHTEVDGEHDKVEAFDFTKL